MREELSDLKGGVQKAEMRRSHKIIFFMIALLALATFAFGILALVGFH